MTDVRPPSPPDEGVRVLRPAFGGAPPDTGPESATVPQPPAPEREPELEIEEYPADPEVGVDTQEISLAELRVAAEAAGVELDEVSIAPPVVVDLAGAERHEAHAEPEVPDRGPGTGAEEPGDGPPGESAATAVASFSGPFGEPGAPAEGDEGVDGAPATDAAEAIDPRIHERRVAVTARSSRGAGGWPCSVWWWPRRSGSPG